MTKILVADDEADLEMLIKQKFRKQIRENKYQFVFALNGNEALKKIQNEPDIDMVLSDINMPELDGLSLLNKLAESNPLIKTVIVSAYGDMENIRTAMNRGAFDFICKPVNFEDLETTIEKTIHHVVQVKDTLKAVKENNILRMYVDETVLKFMTGQEFASTLLANETIVATVMFIDICGFTAISESQPPDVVVRLLNKYFDAMVKEIIAQGGYVDKFIGDAVMAVFKGNFHLDRSIEAALELRKKIEALPTEESYSPKVSIGINSGEMISGNIGSENLKRLDYTVIGDTVNTSQRLQVTAHEGQILITEASYEKVKEFFNCQKVGDMKFKNKVKNMVVYEVLN